MPQHTSAKLPKTQNGNVICLTNMCIKLQNVISMISFVPRLTPWSGALPLDGSHWVLCPQTHTIATAKQAVLCLYRNLNLFLWKCTKTVATRAATFGSDMCQIVCQLELRPRPHWGSLQCSPGKGNEGREWAKEGGEGMESWNAQIHSWQA